MPCALLENFGRKQTIVGRGFRQMEAEQMRRERGENAQTDTYVSGGVERKINSQFRVGRKIYPPGLCTGNST